MDNYAASLIFVKGSNKLDLQVICEKIFEICRENQIIARIRWIPRSLLTEVDRLSRQINYDDWEITGSFLEVLENK